MPLTIYSATSLLRFSTKGLFLRSNCLLKPLPARCSRFYSSKTLQRPLLTHNVAGKILHHSSLKHVAAPFSSSSAPWKELQDEAKKNPAIPSSPTTKHENIYTVPNFLTFTRLVSAPVIGYLVVQGQTTWAVSLFAYSCITDFVDGYIARKYNLQTVVGSVIDPMADKFLMMTLAGTLAVSGSIPIYMAVLILGRDFLLGLSALYFRYISLPAPKTFIRYWDFSIPSAEVHPTTISKYNTFLQMLYVGCSLINPVLVNAVSSDLAGYFTMGLTGLEYTTATTTVLSGLSYVFSRNAVKILK